MPTTTKKPGTFQLRKRDRLRGLIEQAFEQDDRYTLLAVLVGAGVTVMMQGRPPEVAEQAGTKKWLVEIELFPICVVEESDGTEIEALRSACERFLHLLDRKLPNPRPGEDS